MKKKKTFEEEFASSDQWIGFHSQENQRQESYFRAKTDWPVHFRLGGQRSTAFWRRSDIYEAFRRMYGTLRPDILEALRAAGFHPASNESNAPKTRKQLRKSKESQ